MGRSGDPASGRVSAGGKRRNLDRLRRRLGQRIALGTPVQADPLAEAAHRVGGDGRHIRGHGGCSIHESIAVQRIRPRCRGGCRARGADDAVDDVVGIEIRMRRADQCGDAGDDRRGAAGPAPEHQPAVRRDAHEVFARRRDADRDALGRCLQAGPALGIHPCDGQHAGDRRRRADTGRAAPPVARRDDDDDVVLERIEERVIPALVPVRRVGGERQVDDVGAVVDRPADGLGDLIGERSRRRRPEAHRDREQLRLGGDADHAGAGAGAARRGERGDPAAVIGVDRADRGPPVVGAHA